VPFTAAIGHAVGWRWAFVAMAALVVVFAVLTVVSLPPVDHRVPKREVTTTDTGSIVAVPRDRSIIAVGIVAITVLLVATGHNAFYTYIAPWAISVGEVGDDNLSLMLLFYGLAGGLGLLAAGVFGDRAPRLTLNLMHAGLVVAIILTALFARGLVPAVLIMMLWSASFGGLPALYQTRALHAASDRVRNITGAIVTTAFNSAIGLGALLGGVVLDELGIAVVPYVAAAIVAVGTVWVLATDRARLATHSPDVPRGPAAIH
jgi:predicted MFS family arabinose efflux permease